MKLKTLWQTKIRSLAGREVPPDTESELTLDFGVTEDYSSGAFLNSLEQLTEADVPLASAAVSTRKTPAEWFRLFVFYGSAVVFLISCVMLVHNLIDQQRGEEIYSQLEDEFFSQGFDFNISNTEREGDAGVLSQDRGSLTLTNMTENIKRLESGEPIIVVDKNAFSEELQRMRAGLQNLALTNKDTYGWISVDGTRINYPVVQGEDNDYYLDHAYTGEPLVIGSVFVDYKNNRSINKNYNTVFYAHNIASGAMFNHVTKFFEDEYFNNSQIVVYTFDGMFVYEPFAIYESRSDNFYFKTGFASFEDFIEFTEEIKKDASETRGGRYKDIEFTESDRLITLSTCTNGAATQRYALHARLVSYIADGKS